MNNNEKLKKTSLPTVQLKTLMMIIVIMFILFGLYFYYLNTPKKLPASSLLSSIGLTEPKFEFALYGPNGKNLVKPMAVFFDETSQRIYVANTEGHTIEVFDHDGKYLFSFGSPGKDPGKLLFPYGITRIPNGDLLVAEAGNSRIQRFTPDGVYLGIYLDSANPYNILKPGPLLIDSKGAVYIGDLSGGKVVVLDRRGQLIRTVSGLQYPHGIAVDEKNGLLYIANSGSAEVRVCSLSNNSNIPERVIKGHNPKINFGMVRGIATDNNGRLFVVDSVACTIKVFDADGHFRFSFGEMANEDTGLLYPNGIDIDNNGRIYIADWANNRAVVWGY